jgi:hypothetical protein
MPFIQSDGMVPTPGLTATSVAKQQGAQRFTRVSTDTCMYVQLFTDESVEY